MRKTNIYFVEANGSTEKEATEFVKNNLQNWIREHEPEEVLQVFYTEPQGSRRSFQILIRSLLT